MKKIGEACCQCPVERFIMVVVTEAPKGAGKGKGAGQTTPIKGSGGPSPRAAYSNNARNRRNEDRSRDSRTTYNQCRTRARKAVRAAQHAAAAVEAAASSSLASSTSFWARMEVVRAENPPTADERPVERELADSSARRRSSRQRSSPILGPFCPFADGWPSRKD